MEETRSKKNFFSEWLEKLQQESWQLELLISGLALFGIWESQNVIARFGYYIDVFAPSSVVTFLRVFEILLWSSWAIFLINLLIHIILRGFWIGAIGLRYVSGDIDFDELSYSDKFKNYYKKRIGSFDEYIERIERLSSVIFSFTFLLFFMLLSFIVFNMVFAIIISLIFKLVDDPESMNGYVGVFGLIYYGLGLIVLIDFFTLGAFKKIKENTISSIYLWIYRFYSTMSLSFLYRPLLLNFIDNSYTRKLFFLAIPYGIALLGLSRFHLENYSYFPSFAYDADYSTRINAESINYLYYDDEREAHNNMFRRDGDRIRKDPINYISLESYEIDKSELKIFLKYTRRDDDAISDKFPDIDAFRKRGIRHGFMSNDAKDGTIQLDSLLALEIRVARSILKKGIVPDYADSSLINKFQNYNEDDFDTVKDEIQSEYADLRYKYQEDRIAQIKDALKNLYSIRIDDQKVNDAMECEFYIHPNMSERGLMCYHNIDSLSYGKHLIKVYKERKSGGNSIRVPFRKVKK